MNQGIIKHSLVQLIFETFHCSSRGQRVHHNGDSHEHWNWIVQAAAQISFLKVWSPLKHWIYTCIPLQIQGIIFVELHFFIGSLWITWLEQSLCLYARLTCMLWDLSYVR